MAIVPSIVRAMVEPITRGGVGGALGERRRRRVIDELEDHVISGRVGRLEDVVAVPEPAVG